MEIDTHAARVIQVELATIKTRVPTRNIINASRILGDRREPPVSRKVAPGVSVSTVSADIDKFQSKHVACFHSKSKLPCGIMCYATGLRIIAPNHLHPPGTAVKLAQYMRRTFDMLPVYHRYDIIVGILLVGVIQLCLPNSAQVALEAACRCADEPIDSYSAATSGPSTWSSPLLPTASAMTVWGHP
eukprot:jgi/Tetstr1/464513/TSEL_009271.t1